MSFAAFKQMQEGFFSSGLVPVPRMSNELVCLHLIAAMCDRRVKDISDILLKLEFSRIPFDIPRTQSALSSEEQVWRQHENLCQDIFKALLKRYLRGHGHPKCPELWATFNLTPEHCAVVQNNATLHCQVFLHTLTSDPMLPVDPDWKLKVSIHLLVLNLNPYLSYL